MATRKVRKFDPAPIMDEMKDPIVMAYKEVLWALEDLSADEIVEVMDRVEATVTAQLGTK
jgi:hypothetical protein